MELITRTEALEQGLKRYYTGIPCKRGHDCERYTDKCYCIECANISSKKHRVKESPQLSLKHESIRRRRDAIQKGHKHYIPAHQCRNGHTSKRSVKRNDCLECKKETSRKIYTPVSEINDPEKYKVLREAGRKRNRKYRARHPDRVRQWEKRNSEKVKEYQRKYREKSSDDLSDHYVKKLLTANNSPLTATDIPQPLIEAKRAEIKLKRELKERQHDNPNT